MGNGIVGGSDKKLCGGEQQTSSAFTWDNDTTPQFALDVKQGSVTVQDQCSPDLVPVSPETANSLDKLVKTYGRPDEVLVVGNDSFTMRWKKLTDIKPPPPAIVAKPLNPPEITIDGVQFPVRRPEQPPQTVTAYYKGDDGFGYDDMPGWYKPIYAVGKGLMYINPLTWPLLMAGCDSEYPQPRIEFIPGKDYVPPDTDSGTPYTDIGFADAGDTGPQPDLDAGSTDTETDVTVTPDADAQISDTDVQNPDVSDTETPPACPSPQRDCVVPGAVNNCAEGVQFCTENEQGIPQWSGCEPKNTGPEVCNDIDDDCNGTIDDFGDKGTAGDSCVNTNGACSAVGEMVCNISDDPQADPLVCNALVMAPTEEICDGVDNNCNEETDEGFGVGEDCETGTGACVSNGHTVCAPGGATTTCDSPVIQAAPETCNNVDDDCDGITDEALNNVSILTQACVPPNREGDCLNGVQECAPGGTWTECVSTGIQDEICDGLDNNCDGFVDETYPELGAPCSAGNGICETVGEITCAPDKINTVCSAVAGEPLPAELCNGVDDTCDGATDEGFDLAIPCSEGTGPCQTFGETECADDGLDTQCSVTPDMTKAGLETCNGIDDNCDGNTDNGLVTPQADKHFGLCLASVKTCMSAAGWQNPDYSVIPGFENIELTCDGLDNDCDNQTDEGLIGQLASKQAGICAGSQLICSGGDWTEPAYAAIPGYQAVETLCDGVDNDCDGAIDEPNDMLAPAALKQLGICENSEKICFNGNWVEPNYASIAGYQLSETFCDDLDNDCNGATDDVPGAGELCQIGVGACAGLLGNMQCNPETGELVCAGEAGAGTPEVCDGIDNDCDEQTDEGLVAQQAIKHLGVCDGSLKICMGAAGWVEPNYNDIPGYQAAETLCDGLDNDCNGIEDDVPQAGDSCQTGVGICFGAGHKECDTVTGNLVCNTNASSPTNETCNGLDDNCNGQTDDGLAASAPLATNQDGVCEGVKKVCGGVQGWKEPNYETAVPNDKYQAVEALCDNKDNDCDGQTDEGLVGVLTPLQAGVCAGSLKLCVAGVWSSESAYNATPGYQAVETLCDNKDNDCDGQTDEGLVGELTPLQAGVCAGSLKLCVGGVWSSESAYNATPGYQAVETLCDGKDNDCDGLTDNNLIAPQADKHLGVCMDSLKTCMGVNGWVNPNYFTIPGFEDIEQSCDLVDNDCDGEIDANLPDTDNDGTCDTLDNDADNDGVLNIADNCLLVANPLQENMDNDAFGNACDNDIDGDTVLNASDNCQLIVNPLQADVDLDDIGDACDDDNDNDTVINILDNCELVPNPLQEDADLDEEGDVCDPIFNLYNVTENSLAACINASATSCPGTDPLSFPAVIFLTKIDGDSNVKDHNFNAFTNNGVGITHDLEVVSCKNNNYPTIFTPDGFLATYAPGPNFMPPINCPWINSAVRVFNVTQPAATGAASKFTFSVQKDLGGGSKCYEVQYKYPCLDGQFKLPQCNQ